MNRHHRRKAETLTGKRKPHVPGEHNYQRLLAEATAEAMDKGVIERGRVTITNVWHDEWCDIYRGGICNCDPKIEFQPLARPKEIN